MATRTTRKVKKMPAVGGMAMPTTPPVVSIRRISCAPSVAGLFPGRSMPSDASL